MLKLNDTLFPPAPGEQIVESDLPAANAGERFDPQHYVNQISLMVIDELELVRCGLCRVLTDEPDINVVAQAGSAEVALRLLKDVEPDVILIDSRLSGVGGMEVTQRILRLRPRARVIALSNLEAGLLPTRMLKAGAVGFLSKCVSLDDLLRGIRIVHSGQRYISPRIAAQLALNPFEEPGRTPFDALSERELQVALMLIDCHKVNKISDQLCLSPKTVYSYRYRIFEKLGLSSDVELTIMAVKHGLSDASPELVSSDYAYK